MKKNSSDSIIKEVINKLIFSFNTTKSLSTVKKTGKRVFEDDAIKKKVFFEAAAMAIATAVIDPQRFLEKYFSFTAMSEEEIFQKVSETTKQLSALIGVLNKESTVLKPPQREILPQDKDSLHDAFRMNIVRIIIATKEITKTLSEMDIAGKVFKNIEPFFEKNIPKPILEKEEKQREYQETIQRLKKEGKEMFYYTFCAVAKNKFLQAFFRKEELRRIVQKKLQQIFQKKLQNKPL